MQGYVQYSALGIHNSSHPDTASAYDVRQAFAALILSRHFHRCVMAIIQPDPTSVEVLFLFHRIILPLLQILPLAGFEEKGRFL